MCSVPQHVLLFTVQVGLSEKALQLNVCVVCTFLYRGKMKMQFVDCYVKLHTHLQFTIDLHQFLQTVLRV